MSVVGYVDPCYGMDMVIFALVCCVNTVVLLVLCVCVRVCVHIVM